MSINVSVFVILRRYHRIRLPSLSFFTSKKNFHLKSYICFNAECFERIKLFPAYCFLLYSELILRSYKFLDRDGHVNQVTVLLSPRIRLWPREPDHNSKNQIVFKHEFQQQCSSINQRFCFRSLFFFHVIGNILVKSQSLFLSLLKITILIAYFLKKDTNSCFHLDITPP